MGGADCVAFFYLLAPVLLVGIDAKRFVGDAHSVRLAFTSPFCIPSGAPSLQTHSFGAHPSE